MHTEKRKVLIIGGSGFLGRRLLELAQDDMFALHSTYLRAPTGIDGVNEYRLDVNDFKSADLLLSEVRPDVIVYLAKSLLWNTDPDVFSRAYSAFLGRVKHWNARLVYFSTDAVFDGTRGMYTEDDDPHPVSPYGIWKKMAEDMTRNALPGASIVRTSYIYGRNRNGVDKRTRETFDALSKGVELRRYSDMYRSVTFVDDLALATWHLVGLNFGGILHIAGRRMGLFDFYRTLAEAFGYDFRYLIPETMTEPDVFGRDTSLDSSLAGRVLRFVPSAIDRF